MQIQAGQGLYHGSAHPVSRFLLVYMHMLITYQCLGCKFNIFAMLIRVGFVAPLFHPSVVEGSS